MLSFFAGDKSTGRCDNPPPRQTVDALQCVADRSGGTRKAGLESYLPVGHDLTRREGPNDLRHRFVEVNAH